MLVTGSRDSTVAVWIIGNDGIVHGCALHSLVGHDDEVTCVSARADLDLVASASLDGTCILHTLHKGQYLRTIRRTCMSQPSLRLHWVVLSRDGHVALYSYDDRIMTMYTINGQFLSKADTSDQ